MTKFNEYKNYPKPTSLVSRFASYLNRAQRDAARRRKSVRGWNPVPETWKSFVSGPKFTRFFFAHAGGIAVDQCLSDFGFPNPFRRYSRSNFLKLSDVDSNFVRFGHQICFGGGPQIFSTGIIKLNKLPTMLQSLKTIGRARLEISRWKQRSTTWDGRELPFRAALKHQQ